MKEMADPTFSDKLTSRFAAQKFLCVGLDPEYAKIPASLVEACKTREDALYEFGREMMDATADIVTAWKPNSAFYEAEGADGIRALKRVMDYAHETHPEIALILDAKRGDIGSTNEGYARFAFDYLGADALTVHPYLGREALEPLFARPDKGVFVLVRTSNPGGGEFQDLDADGMPLYQRVAESIAREWKGKGTCGVVAGATYPEELARVRSIVGDMTILVPGVGAQGGDIKQAVRAAKNADGKGFIISTSRVVLYASAGPDFADAARKTAQGLDGEIQAALTA